LETITINYCSEMSFTVITLSLSFINRFWSLDEAEKSAYQETKPTR